MILCHKGHINVLKTVYWTVIDDIKGFLSKCGVKSIDLDKNRHVFVQMWGKMHRFGQKHIGRLVFSVCATEDYPVSPRRHLMRDKKTCKAKSQNVRDIWLLSKRY